MDQRSLSESKEAGLQNGRKSSDQESFKLTIKRSRTIFADQNLDPVRKMFLQVV